MNVTSKRITCKLSQLVPYAKAGFAGVCGSCNDSGGFSLVVDPEVTKQELDINTNLTGILTVVQWDSNIPISPAIQLAVLSISDPDSITPDLYLLALEDSLNSTEK